MSSLLKGRPIESGARVAPRAGVSPGGLALAAVVLLAWFTAFTGARPLNVPDEGRYADIARQMLVTGDWITPRLNGVPFLDKPALFYWLDAAAMWAFGVHVWSARLVPAALGALGCLFVLVAGARLFSTRAGLLAATVLATNPYYFAASQYVNHDLAVAVWITGALAFFVTGDDAQGAERTWWLLAAYLFAALAFLTKGLIGVVFPLGIAGLWVLLLARWSELKRYRMAAGLALFVAIAAPWYVAAQRANPDFFHYFFVVQHFERYAARGFNNPHGVWFYPALLAVGFLPWTGFLPAAAARAWQRFRSDRSNARAEPFLLLWPVFVVAFFSLPVSKIAGYVLPALPPLALFVGRYADDVIGRACAAPRRLWIASAIGMALAGAAALAVSTRAGVLPRSSMPGLVVLGSGALLIGLALLAAARRGMVRSAWTAHAAFGAWLCAGLALLAGNLADQGAKPLADMLLKELRPGDRVVHFRDYFYDVPFYLDAHAPVFVASRWEDPAIPTRDSWERELWLGLQSAREASRWLIPEARVREVCSAPARCFVLVRAANAAAAGQLTPLEKIAEHRDTQLLATPTLREMPSAGSSGK